jgi:hypothetical protein
VALVVKEARVLLAAMVGRAMTVVLVAQRLWRHSTLR